MLFEIVKQVCSTRRLFETIFLLAVFHEPRNTRTLLLICWIAATLWTLYLNLSHALPQAVSRLPLTTEARVQFQASTYGIFGVLNDTGTGFSSVRPRQYHSTNAPYSYFIYLQLPLYNHRNCQRRAINTSVFSPYLYIKSRTEGLSFENRRIQCGYYIFVRYWVRNAWILTSTASLFLSEKWRNFRI